MNEIIIDMIVANLTKKSPPTELIGKKKLIDVSLTTCNSIIRLGEEE